MSAFRLAVGFALVVGIAGCGLDEDTATDVPDATPDVAPSVMPDVVGQKLDVALSDIERAGIEDEVEVLGGGTFGVVVESKWRVCDQLPRGGEMVTSAPRLTVDRSCEDDSPEQTTPPTTAGSEPNDTAPGTTSAEVPRPLYDAPASTSAPEGTMSPVTLPPVTLPPVTLPPVTLPPSTSPPVTAPPTTAAPAPSSVYYANCSAARAAGAAPLYRGEPGYRSGLDRDNDGVACE